MSLTRNNKASFLKSVALPLWGMCCSVILLLVLISGQDGVWIALGFLGLLLLSFLCRRFLRVHNLPVFILICGIVFLVIQIVLVFSYYFETGWDVQGIVAAAEQFARREKVTAYLFSRFPNNLLMTILYSRCFRIAFSLGLSRDCGYQMILCVQCLLFFAAGQLTFYTARKITVNDSFAVVAYFVFLALIGFSPWVSILYSDALGLVFPIAILYLYLLASENKRPALLWPLIGFLSFVGYKIKPTVMIVFIAAMLLELSVFQRRRSRKRLLLALGGVLAGMALCSAVIFLSGYQLDKEKPLGAAHFLAMGLNEETGGCWSGDDINYSMTFPTTKERTRGDLELAKSRIREMGARRLWKHLVRKTIINYNDGTFSWAGEGNFFRVIREETDPVISPWIRSFYYNNGENFNTFQYFEQSVWLSVLLLTVFAAFSPSNTGSAAVALTLLGLFAYSLLFEARARYLFVYSPFYILLAVLGLQVISEWLRKRRGQVSAS